MPVDDGDLRHLAGSTAFRQGPHIPDDALLLRLTGNLIVDVGEAVTLGVEIAVTEEHPIRVHGVHGDKVLGGAGTLEVVFLPVSGLQLLFALQHSCVSLSFSYSKCVQQKALRLGAPFPFLDERIDLLASELLYLG